MNLVEELRWRGMLHNIIPGTEEVLQTKKVLGYVGFDPTADALHVGNLVPILLLMHLQRAGHRPIALIGGATGMIGDPSGKSEERNLLTEETLQKNIAGIRKDLSKFLNFDDTQGALLVNNWDWMRDFSFIEFARDVGKRITINYMMAKDSVKKRVNSEDGGVGMSFTEFTYQLIQGYDFYHLHKTYGCSLQMGGSDQWGNITTGTELIRKMNEEEVDAFALTCPLITKADGSKFGKSEQGNIWLDSDKTSVYAFYQFWLNSSDEDAANYLRIFSFLTEKEVNAILEEHDQAPHLRTLQKTLAREVTTLVHGAEELEKVEHASQILFSKNVAERLSEIDEKTFYSIFEGVPQGVVTQEALEKGLDLVEALAGENDLFASKAEVRRAIKEGSLAINKIKISDSHLLRTQDLIANRYILVSRGKKRNFLLKLQ